MSTPESVRRPEFSRLLRLEDIPEEGYRTRIGANAEESAALSTRFSVPAIEQLEAELVAEWVERDEVLRVSGRIRASATQSCVVTLEPVEASVDEEIDLLFGREEADTAPGVELEIDPEETEPLIGEEIDLGEIVATEFALSLDPYPRHPDIHPDALHLGPGATLSGDDSPESGRNAPRNRPFEVLAGLKPKL